MNAQDLKRMFATPRAKAPCSTSSDTETATISPSTKAGPEEPPMKRAKVEDLTDDFAEELSEDVEEENISKKEPKKDWGQLGDRALLKKVHDTKEAGWILRVIHASEISESMLKR